MGVEKSVKTTRRNRRFRAPLFIRIQVFERPRFSAFSPRAARGLWRKNVAVTMRYKSAADLTYFGSTHWEDANKLLFEGRWGIARDSLSCKSRQPRNQPSRSSNGGLSGGSSGR
ncbi:hypothetical protein PCAR4_360012 [Paraburkholderia caribensis]|nr:hypothetical protein PCAR4_360012 [Paraburkholderia caribensis]